MDNMEFVLICIVLFLGKSSQKLNSEELDNILDKLIDQIKNYNTTDVTIAPTVSTNLDESRSSEESKIIYLKTYNKPIIDFIPDNVNDIAGIPQEYSKNGSFFPALGDSRSLVETSKNETEYISVDGSIDNIPPYKDQDVTPINESKIIFLKDHNKPISPDVEKNTSHIAAKPLETQEARRNFDNLLLPDNLLRIIKENKDKGNILKEMVVEIIRNAENNSTTDAAGQSRSSESPLMDDLENVINITTNTKLSDISTERSKTIIEKISGKKRRQKIPILRDTKSSPGANSRKQHEIDSPFTDRTVLPELRQQNKPSNQNVPQVLELDIIYPPKEIENLESRPFLWRNMLPKTPRCESNCMRRKFFSHNNLYPTAMSKILYVPNSFVNQPVKPSSYIITPSSTQLQIERALQNQYSVSTSQQNSPYYITDFMNKIWSRKIYQPLHNKLVYL